jgi:MazG family protein
LAVPPPDRSRPAIERLVEIMARLRDPDEGCPWDVEQDFASIAPYTIEEAYEVADAIARGEVDDLKNELGDLLLQVVYHAQMAGERDWFDFDAVAAAVADKLVARHPHVFGDGAVDGAAAQRIAWEDSKQRERAERAATRGEVDHAMADVPLALPALKRAQKLQGRAARVGFDWPDAAGAMAKVREELHEVEGAGGERAALEAEVGDLLFAAVNLARHLDVGAEEALQAASRRFERRFAAIEDALAARGLRPEEVDLDTLEALWVEAKRTEAKG